MRGLRLCGVLMLLLLVPGGLAGQERGRQLQDVRAGAPADTDSVALARGDTIPLDSLPRIDVDKRRQELGGGDFPDKDADFQRLSGLTGFRVMEYRGEAVELEIDAETIRLLGQAQANYGSDVLRADTIEYQGLPQFIRAKHNIDLVGAGQAHVTSDSLLYYDVSRLKGTIFDAETEFAERGAQWFVKGTAVPKGQDTVFVTRGAFTSCEYDEPHYFFKAGRIKLVAENVIVAWPVTLYVSDVPVFWLPFFAQDIRPGRHSGFIPPRFGFNDIVKTSDSYNRQISDFGYYWAINEFTDFRGTVDWFSGQYTRLNGIFNYNFLKEFVRGSARANYSFGNSGKVWDVRLNHNHELSAVTNYRVNLGYVNNTRLFTDQSFDPRDQTQTIDSELGFAHRWPFASVTLNAQRRQFLGAADQVTLTLPRLGIALSPVTLFKAPRSRAGAFNNITWNGQVDFSRTEITNELTDDRLTTDARVGSNVRVGNLNWTSSGSFNEIMTSPFDTVSGPGPDFSLATINWDTRLSYQINLLGPSTRLSPQFALTGIQFKSQDTNNDFLAAPTRWSFGAQLGTEIFGFWPGFGPFSRVRHKLSPRIGWDYVPEVSLTQQQMMIPGFPVSAGDAQNRLSISLTQTFEAKVRPKPGVTDEVDTTAEGRALVDDIAGEIWDRGRHLQPLGWQTPPLPAEQERTAPPGGPATPLGVSQLQPEERTVVLLSWNITTPLVWDFARASRNEPTLLTESFTSIFTSDLLRGLTVNITHDLFEGIGTNRDLAPFLQSVSAQFSLRSGLGLGDIVGLGRDQFAPVAGSPGLDQSLRAGSRFGPANQFDAFEQVQTGSGPWDIAVSYSLARIRAGEAGTKNQTLGGAISLQPTPNWRIRWATQYNFTQKEFGAQLITLDRSLHRWMASFQFSKAPNGNVLFQFFVQLRDAPELKVDYGQSTNPPTGL